MRGIDRRLVLGHPPTALAAVGDLDDDAIGPTELLEWLRSDHETTMSLYAVLTTGCRPDYPAQALPIRITRDRTPGGLPGPPAPKVPRPRREQGHQCESLPDPAPVILVEETPAPTADALICVLDQALPDTEPAPPEHRGNRSCHEQRRHVIRFNPATATHEDLGPCPRCHPDRARESAAWVRAPRMVGLLDLPTHAPRIDRAEQCEQRIDDPPQPRGADIVYPSWSGR